MLEAINFRSRADQNILRKTEITQQAMSSLRSAQRRLLRFRHDDKEIDVTVIGGRAPGVRSKKVDGFRTKRRHETLDRFFELSRRNDPHAPSLAEAIRKRTQKQTTPNARPTKPLVSAFTPGVLQKTRAPGADVVTLIVGGVFLVILLVILFRGVKRSRWQDVGGDWLLKFS